MKKLVVGIIFLLMLVSFVNFSLAHDSETEDSNSSDEHNSTIVEDDENESESEEIQQHRRNPRSFNNIESDERSELGERREIDEVERKRILAEGRKIKINSTDLPEDCTETDSIITCSLNGTTLIISPGDSNNTIIQIGDFNISINAEIYKEGDDIFAVFGNNKTIQINSLDELIRRFGNRLGAEVRGNQTTVELDEDGKYQIETTRESLILGFLPVKERIRAQVDAETGEIESLRGPWWSFFRAEGGSQEILEE